MKISRNQPCPCGSEKKYKRCCIDKSYEDKYMESLVDTTRNLKRESRIKQCLHPNSQECSSNIVKAHAIQNNRILTKLAIDGCVISMDGSSHMIFQDAQNKGRKIATTFTGFCSFHDKTVFQEIEDIEFNATPKQLFLFTYRTFAWHFHKKQEQINATRILENKMGELGYKKPHSQEYEDLLYGYSLAERDNNLEKNNFNEYLLANDYSKVSSVIWEIPYEVNFAISMMNGLEHDIKGNKINEYGTDKSIKDIYLNIFPCQNKSYCIWSWLKDNDNIYKNFSKQFMQLDLKDKVNYLNNQMPRWSDAIIISPSLWNKWGKEIQEALITHSNFKVLYRALEEEEIGFAYQYMDTPWDFFDELPKEIE